MNSEQNERLAWRAAVHAALADPARLRITDALGDGDASPKELGAMLAMPSNLLAHHLRVLEASLSHHPPPLRRRPPPQLPAAGPRCPGIGGGTARAGRPAGAVCVHRQLGPFASGRGAVGPGQQHPGGIGRYPSGGGDRSGRYRCRWPSPPAAAPPAAPAHYRGPAAMVIFLSLSATWRTRSSATWRRCTGPFPHPVPPGDPASFDAALAELAHRVERFAPRLAAS